MDLSEYIIRRWEELESERRTYEGIWQAIADLVIPHKNQIQNANFVKGGSRRSLQFDSTAEQANILLASTLHATMTSWHENWFYLEVPGIEHDFEVSEWLEQTASAILQVINASNFNEEANELYLDLPAFGTGTMFVEETDDNEIVRFKTLNIGEYAITEDHSGRVDGVWRNVKMTPRQIRQKFDRVPPAIQDILSKDGAGSNQTFDIIHAVFPRTDRNPDKKTADQKPYASVWVFPAGQDRPPQQRL